LNFLFKLLVGSRVTQYIVVTTLISSLASLSYLAYSNTICKSQLKENNVTITNLIKSLKISSHEIDTLKETIFDMNRTCESEKVYTNKYLQYLLDVSKAERENSSRKHVSHRVKRRPTGAKDEVIYYEYETE